SVQTRRPGRGPPTQYPGAVAPEQEQGKDRREDAHGTQTPCRDTTELAAEPEQQVRQRQRVLVKRGIPDHAQTAERKDGGVELVFPERLGRQAVRPQCRAKDNDKNQSDRWQSYPIRGVAGPVMAPDDPATNDRTKSHAFPRVGSAAMDWKPSNSKLPSRSTQVLHRAPRSAMPQM